MHRELVLGARVARAAVERGAAASRRVAHQHDAPLLLALHGERDRAHRPHAAHHRVRHGRAQPRGGGAAVVEPPLGLHFVDERLDQLDRQAHLPPPSGAGRRTWVRCAGRV
eukprot:3691132-Prymnesium_polylepis.1